MQTIFGSMNRAAGHDFLPAESAGALRGRTPLYVGADHRAARDVRFLDQTSFPLTAFVYAEPELSLSVRPLRLRRGDGASRAVRSSRRRSCR